MSEKINLAEFEEIDTLIRNATRRATPRGGDYTDGLEIHSNVKAFLQRMLDAERADRKLNRLKQPALNKLKMLPEVVDCLSNKQMQHQLLDALLLQRVRDWLRPLPDGSLPALQVRSDLYRLLAQLPIDSDHLQESEGLGMELMRLWRSEEETEGNRKVLKKLIEGWIRGIFANEAEPMDLERREEQIAAKAPKVVANKVVRIVGKRRTRFVDEFCFAAFRLGYV